MASVLEVSPADRDDYHVDGSSAQLANFTDEELEHALDSFGESKVVPEELPKHIHKSFKKEDFDGDLSQDWAKETIKKAVKEYAGYLKFGGAEPKKKVIFVKEDEQIKAVIVMKNRAHDRALLDLLLTQKGAGYVKRMIGAALMQAFEWGKARLELHAVDSAIGFYEYMQFEREGRDGDDCEIMSKEIALPSGGFPRSEARR
eukprot:TRINITY_DN77140_c0_g1_i1.p1 TRINITY_DN77140_c0_g1~~TRINITY_DN77140_c0_g1_i1.p1  ORF type:complete len:202 (+),score=55.78 TRINITY_DN77140_c0_g1_i1:104-709(+)